MKSKESQFKKGQALKNRYEKKIQKFMDKIDNLEKQV